MPRIDASLATQVGDYVRPQQSARDSQLQVSQARLAETEQAETDPGNQEVSADDLQAATAQIRQVVEAAGIKQLAFGFGQDDKTGDRFVVIRDQESGEVIKQIPGEEVLALRKRLRETIGIMFDKQA